MVLGLEGVLDPHVQVPRQLEVAVDLEARIHDGGDARLLVADQVGSAAEIVVGDLSEDHVSRMTDADETRLLLLFDIDGTLLRYGGAREHAAALLQALREVYPVEPTDDAVTRVGPWAQSDRGTASQ